MLKLESLEDAVNGTRHHHAMSVVAPATVTVTVMSLAIAAVMFLIAVSLILYNKIISFLCGTGLIPILSLLDTVFCSMFPLKVGI